VSLNDLPLPGEFRDVELPEKLAFLFEPHQYKVLYGGRGGIKSWSIAQALLLLGAQRQLRILCARELQKSIDESVHHLLELQIERLGLGWFYRVEKAAIFGLNGTEFRFTGLRDAANLKSYEDFDICWVEEAANVSKRSWDLLLPTLRKKGSEVWISFNPELGDDETYKRWVKNPPPGTVVCKTSWRDNNWLTDELRSQKDHSQATDPDGYLCTWEGHPKQVLDGAIYADELRWATQNGHICRVPYEPLKPVHTYWDLGIADQTSIWFVQSIAFEHRFIDFYQNRNKDLAHYQAELQKRGYVYGRHNLPHDGRRRDLGTGKSIEMRMQEAGFPVRIVPNIGLQNGMDAARALFKKAFFDEEKCQDGLNCLRRYRWRVDPVTRIYSKEPLHDDNSNGADAYRMAAVGLTEPDKGRPKIDMSPAQDGGWAWG
jgi:phage terminase large subunit